MLAWMRQRERSAHHGVRGGVLCLSDQDDARESVTAELLAEESEPTLVVCAKRALASWQKNFPQACTLWPASDTLCGPEEREERLFLTTYDLACRCFREENLAAESEQRIDEIGHRLLLPLQKFTLCRGPLVLYRTPWRRIIFDDAQRLCNDRNLSFAACMALPGQLRWAYTDTPVRNSGLVDVKQLLRVIGFRYQVYLHEPWSACYNEFDLAQLLYSVPLSERAALRTTMVDLLSSEAQRREEYCVAERSSASQRFSASQRSSAPERYSAAERRLCACSLAKIEWLSQHFNDCERLLILSSFPEALELVSGLHECFHLHSTEAFDGSAVASSLAMTYQTFGSLKRLDLSAFDCVLLWDPWYSPEPLERILSALGPHGRCFQMICRDTIEQQVAQIAAQKRNSARAVLSASQAKVCSSEN